MVPTLTLRLSNLREAPCACGSWEAKPSLALLPRALHCFPRPPPLFGCHFLAEASLKASEISVAGGPSHTCLGSILPLHMLTA